ncbi:MAG: iron-containing alcohol dehydrogenase, partial [Bacteroidota bacterium]
METTPLMELAIAPARVLSGFRILDVLGDLVPGNPLVVGGPTTLPRFQEEIRRILPRAVFATYGADSCQETLDRLTSSPCDAVVGLGGGKALDTAKMVAHRLSVPCITVPTSPATCAAWSALSNLYSEEGTWLETIVHPAPQALVLDYALAGRVPPRLLASGMADALAKWYEGRSTKNPDAMTRAALGIAQQLKETILEVGIRACKQVSPEQDPEGIVLEAIDASIRLPGLVGGIGGEKCRSVAAHALANALTAFDGHKASLHGEKVGFGILVQLLLEGAPASEVWEVAEFFHRIGVPLTLAELGVRASAEEIAQ